METDSTTDHDQQDDLVLRYKASKHLDKLKISDESWQRAVTADPELRKTAKKQEWLGKIFDVSAYDITMRESLRYAPESLIALVEEGLVMRSAFIMLKEARQLSARKQITIQAAMEIVITTYKSGPRRYSDDKTWFWTKPTLAKAASSRAKVKSVEESDSVRTLWATIRSALAQIATKKAGEEMSPLVLEEASAWFEKELQRVVDGFTTRIRKNKKKQVVEVNRMQYANACKVLGIVPTDVGEEIDVEVAKAAKKSLARRYHPDGGGESTEKYQQIIEAYETVDLYAEQMKRIARNQNKSRKGE
jgi:hypothetical protein